jgi:hypothetical protein
MNTQTKTLPLVCHPLPAPRMPDTETTVICILADGDWHSGWWDSEQARWMEAATGGELEGVVAWAEPDFTALTH